MNFARYIESKEVENDNDNYNLVMVGVNPNINKYGGKFYIEDSEIDTFYLYCSSYLSENENNYINFSQRINDIDITPLLLDFDIEVENSEDYAKLSELYDIKFQKVHIYSEDDIMKIISIINKIINDYFDVSTEDIKAYVMEKRKFSKKDNGIFKDGFHIVYLIPFSKRNRFFIRYKLIEEMERIDLLGKYRPKNPENEIEVINFYDKIVDDAVIARNPWMVYGAVKALKDKIPKYPFDNRYELSMIIDYEGYNEYLDIMDYEELLPIFNVRQYDKTEEVKNKVYIDYSVDYATIRENNKKMNQQQQIKNNYQKKQKQDYNSDSDLMETKESSFYDIATKKNKKNNDGDVFIFNPENKLSYKTVIEIIDLIEKYKDKAIALYETEEKKYKRGLFAIYHYGKIGNFDKLAEKKNKKGESILKTKQIAKRFSKLSKKKYNEADFEKNYNRFDKEYERDLKKWGLKWVYAFMNDVRNIDIPKFNKIMEEAYEKKFLNIINSLTDQSIADYLKALHGASIKCTNPDNKKMEWYVFPNIIEAKSIAEVNNIDTKFAWILSPGGQCVKDKIKRLYDYTQRYLNKTIKRLYKNEKGISEGKEKDNDYDSEDESENYIMRLDDKDAEIIAEIYKKPIIKKIKALINKLGNNSGINSILNVCASTFYDKEFVEKLNEDKNIIAFNNGFFDFRDMKFHEPDSSKYYSFTTGYNYVDYSDINKEKTEIFEIDDQVEDIEKQRGQILKEIDDYMKHIFTDEKDREYMWKFCASILNGQLPDESFYLWTGKGSNGKSLFNDFLKNVLGDYYSTASASLIVMKRGASNAANPELANKKGKRVIIINEPEETDIIYAGKMKELTGGDAIETRGLFKDPFTFKPQFRIILICNNQPTISGLDNGTWRRIKVVEYSSVFGSVYQPKNKKFYIDQNVKKMITNKIWCQGFIWLLLNKYYPKFKTEKLKETPIMLRNQSDYKYRCDEFIEFLESNYIIIKPEYITDSEPFYVSGIPKEERTDIIYWDNFYDKYKEWYARHKDSKSKVKAWKTVKDYLEKQTNCKIYKDKNMDEFIIGLKERKKTRRYKEEEDDEMEL